MATSALLLVDTKSCFSEHENKNNVPKRIDKYFFHNTIKICV